MEYRQLQLFSPPPSAQPSHAAEAMNITQPDSKSMHRLQRARHQLYHRCRGIELTESDGLSCGRKDDRDTAFRRPVEVTGIAGGKLGHARIGAGPRGSARKKAESIARVIEENPSSASPWKRAFQTG
jgi:hypothetical protein